MVPRAIVFSLVTSTGLYFLVVFALLMAMGWAGYGSVSSPLSLALSAIRAPPWVSLLVTFSALTATLTVTLSLIIAGSRTTRQMGVDGLMPRWLGKGSLPPTAAVACLMLASLALGDVKTIALVANFGVIFSYMLSGFEVVVTRRRGLQGEFRSPGYPYVQAFSIALSVLLLLSLGPESLTAGVGALVVGLFIHVVQVEFRLKAK